MLKIILLSTIIFSATSCFQIFDVGKNYSLKEAYNKKGSKKAILFSKEGNATSDNSLQVTVEGYDYKFDKTAVGNTFTVDSDHNSAKQDSSSINFTWLTNDTLQIDYDKKLRVFIQEKKVEDVVVLYKSR
jgi:hypothetical protein